MIRPDTTTFRSIDQVKKVVGSLDTLMFHKKVYSQFTPIHLEMIMRGGTYV